LGKSVSGKALDAQSQLPSFVALTYYTYKTT